ncbi:hypothetical protein B0T25DRAFT_571667 [Lasiosphaeria hispida]|uniref:Uncharacterized protein n=1 Tax=Lasiosphaeria hispida TaxID=260671 RepID=A0AAJ0HBG5_9PEZI|nr:hypothetical protein B0T25DRAFT_571667 [Lasiosphaeria hispida]
MAMVSHTRARAQARSNDFNDDAGFSDTEDPGQDPAPLSNPPPSRKLSTHKYESLEDLMADLDEYCARAHFAVVKIRSNNYVKDFKPTRQGTAEALLVDGEP